MSEAIERLVALAQSAGLEGHQSKWNEATVHWFGQPMPDAVRRAAANETGLEYSHRPAEPWMAAHELFFDPAHKVGIVFETGAR